MNRPERTADPLFTPQGTIRPDILTPALSVVFKESLSFARQTHWESLRTPHLFMAMLCHPEESVRAWVEDAELDSEFIVAQFRRLFTNHDQPEPEVVCFQREFMSLNVIRLLRSALERCHDCGRSRMTVMDILMPILASPGSVVAECFDTRGIASHDLLEIAVRSEARVRV